MTTFKKGTRVNWLGKEMYLGGIVQINIDDSGMKSFDSKEEAEYDTDQLTFIPVEGQDTPDKRLSISLFEARQLIKKGHFKLKEEDDNN